MANKHYVDNAEFLEVMKRYKQYKEIDDETPLPDQAALNIMRICHRLANSPNFANYTYKQEMIQDGIENCFKYVDNFNPEVSSNPFGYFTQIAYFAFLRRIELEKKQMKTKAKWAYNLGVMNESTSDVQEHDQDEEFDNSFLEWLQNYYIEHEAEKAANEKKNSYSKDKENNQEEEETSPSPLGEFMQGENNERKKS